jgi:hypothetical protein
MFQIKNGIILTTLTTTRTLLGSYGLWVTEIYALWKKPADYFNHPTNVASQTAVFFRHVE